MYELTPTNTAAIPTKEWNAAMSSGIWVISTLRAMGPPTDRPMASTATMSSAVSHTDWRSSGFSVDRYREYQTVAASARAMPAIPMVLPARAVAGLESPARDRMNITPATMYRP